MGFFQGQPGAFVRRYSDTLLIFRLKAEAPDKYRERISTEHSGPGGGPMVLTDMRKRTEPLPERDPVLLRQLAGNVKTKPNGNGNGNGNGSGE